MTVGRSFSHFSLSLAVETFSRKERHTASGVAFSADFTDPSKQRTFYWRLGITW
jgi:hypothetical protein